MFYDNRQQIRAMFFQVWDKHHKQLPIEPLENRILQVILAHPEYQKFLDARYVEQDFTPEMGETNPFLHMGLHIGVQEQLSTDRPSGIRALYQAALAKGQDSHRIDHIIMECLAEMMWHMQRNQTMPDESAYLTCIRSQLDKQGIRVG